MNEHSVSAAHFDDRGGLGAGVVNRLAGRIRALVCDSLSDLRDDMNM